MTETQIKSKILKMLKYCYPNVWVYKTADKFTSGIPDILMCANGHLWAMEVKRPKYEASLLQQYVINTIRDAGGRVAVVHNVEEAKLFMERGC